MQTTYVYRNQEERTDAVRRSTIEQISALIEDWMDDGKCGSITINFQFGGIRNIQKLESVKIQTKDSC